MTGRNNFGRKALLLAAGLMLCLPAFSLEFGAVLSDMTDFKFDGKDFDSKFLDQRETLSPWLKAELGADANFSAEGSAQHKYKGDFDGNSDNSLVLDLGLFKLDKTIRTENSNSVQLALGRMPFADSTRLVFAQPADGAFVKFSSPRFEAFAYGGYTGLLNIKNNTILLCDGSEYALEKEADLYDFAAPYVAGALSLSAPYLFLNQTVSLETLGVFASKGPSELPDAEDDARLYGTLSFKGALASSLFYSLSGTMETTQEFEDFALLSKFGLDYYAPAKDASVGLSAVYASGKNGGLSPFLGFTKIAACLSAGEPIYSGILKGGISGSIKPVKNLLISAGCDAIYAVPEDKAEYYGIQASAALRWQVFSDVQLSALGNIFFGDDEGLNRAEVTLGAAFAL